MKVIVATSRTQGIRPDDFCWTEDGELVRFRHLICDTDLMYPDDGCGCGRAWSGLHSQRAGTTAEVVERALTRQDVVTALASYLYQSGWTSEELPDDSREDIYAEVDELLALARFYPVGTVLGRRLDTIIPR
jgi:hypothetical protein